MSTWHQNTTVIDWLSISLRRAFLTFLKWLPELATTGHARQMATACVYVLSSLSVCSQGIAADTVPRQRDVPNFAFYYQDGLPTDELQAFDVVVVDAARTELLDAQRTPHTAWFARIDVRKLPGSSSATSQDAVVKAVQSLWDKGYRGFLLQDGAGIDHQINHDSERLDAILKALHAAYPQARLMLRNHLPVARSNAEILFAVVADSLYRRETGYGGFLAEVPERIRESALHEIRKIQAETQLPVVAVDYCPKKDKACRRHTAEQLIAEGVLPFVTAPGFGIVGIGRIEVMPRKVLLVQSLSPAEPLDRSLGARAIAMPLNYLGYDIRYADINKGLPTDITSDRYAGIVVALDRSIPNAAVWRQWLLARIQEGIRVAVVNQFGFPIDARTASALDLELVAGTTPVDGTPRLVHQAPIMGFEFMPAPDVRSATGIRVGATGRPLLRLDAGGYVYDAAAITSWGGYALAPYGMASLNAIGQYRWTFQPLEFFREALGLVDMPVPDLTSENGRRLMFTQVNGDGFASKAEFSHGRGQYSGEVL
nr:hypothetical protein [Pseudomonas sp.]